ncbi:Hypothetical Protein FCC1311_010342 [Hondaea fermentalgiana]|uniref:Uncharacterized protein n=1 Tax=Hondaea fermentalgiana TaxID=2315210 RepID=A0A2R5G1B4_9STRA|nr:Hypothetical Protein FCC1311_010342 [Hondaea fermentalgiana]|eukprot:GBG24816.1 Hypothetical Protein FCC1311_010342 [Hondaea fermentalgiana]
MISSDRSNLMDRCAPDGFNCIDTTCADARSADTFQDIEVGILERMAKVAKSISHASVVLAPGANSGSPFVPESFHLPPFFYEKTIGLKERALTSTGFPRMA